MKPLSIKPFSAIKNHRFTVLHFGKRQLYINLLFFVILFSASILSLSAQEVGKNNFSANASEMVLRIKGLRDPKMAANVNAVLNSYPGKILSHSMDAANNTVKVLISAKLKPVDLLQVLDLNGIDAGYIDGNNEYVTLDNNDREELAAPRKISK